MTINRKERAEIARQTLEVIEQGFYLNDAEEKVQIEGQVEYAVENSQLYSPQKLQEIVEKSEVTNTFQNRTIIEVNNESSLQAAERTARHEYNNPACLNFASAKNPGGGFLEGSGAQEESLARSSALYPCIKQMNEMYNANKNYGSSLYLDYMIYSPDVPVFRRDNGEFLNSPYKMSFITAPAVNAGAVKANEPENVDKISPTMKQRIEKILSLAKFKEVDALILGAFGCGVFQNNHRDVAEYFSDYLHEDERFTEAFEKVIFAVLDSSPNQETYKTFENKLQK